MGFFEDQRRTGPAGETAVRLEILMIVIAVCDDDDSSCSLSIFECWCCFMYAFVIFILLVVMIFLSSFSSFSFQTSTVSQHFSCLDSFTFFRHHFLNFGVVFCTPLLYLSCLFVLICVICFFIYSAVLSNIHCLIALFFHVLDASTSFLYRSHFFEFWCRFCALLLCLSYLFLYARFAFMIGLANSRVLWRSQSNCSDCSHNRFACMFPWFLGCV